MPRASGWQPTLAVLLCNYNHGHCVARALEALVTQSRPPDELVIVDDGSTDNSIEVLERFAREHAFVRLIRHPQNRGIAGAMTTALASASSDYLYTAASDDYVLPGFFEAIMALAADYPDAGLLFGLQVLTFDSGFSRLQDDAPRWTSPTFATPERFLNEYLREATALHSQTTTYVYRRAAYEEAGGLRAELGYWTDTFLARAVALGHGAAFVPRACAVFSFDPNGYCGRQIRDMDLALAPIPRIAALMRSPLFASRFPAEYVNEWERLAIQDVIDFHCWLRYLLPAEEFRRRRMRALAGLGHLGETLARAQTMPQKVAAEWMTRITKRYLRWSRSVA